MKANEAPEKIYTNYIGYGLFDEPTTMRVKESQIEYVRRDAFIEKVCKGIEHLLSGYIIRNFHFGDSYEMDTFIEDIKTYMKGE